MENIENPADTVRLAIDGEIKEVPKKVWCEIRYIKVKNACDMTPAQKDEMMMRR